MPKLVMKLSTLGFWKILKKSRTVIKTNSVFICFWENLKKIILKEDGREWNSDQRELEGKRVGHRGWVYIYIIN